MHYLLLSYKILYLSIKIIDICALYITQLFIILTGKFQLKATNPIFSLYQSSKTYSVKMYFQVFVISMHFVPDSFLEKQN